MTYPPDFACPKEKQVTAQVAAQCISGLAPARRAVVQAGGCSGLWPMALAHYFDRVYTFEPAPLNFEYLVRNISDVPNIRASDCALADRCGTSGLTRPKAGAGLWHLEGDGEVDVVTLDSLRFNEPIDAIVLDVEGAEVQAFNGAEQIITTHHPLLWFEYLHHTAEIDAFLAAHGYRPPERGIGADYYSIHASRAH